MEQVVFMGRLIEGKPEDTIRRLEASSHRHSAHIIVWLKRRFTGQAPTEIELADARSNGMDL